MEVGQNHSRSSFRGVRGEGLRQGEISGSTELAERPNVRTVREETHGLAGVGIELFVALYLELRVSTQIFAFSPWINPEALNNLGEGGILI